jgi:hypothetical protein
MIRAGRRELSDDTWIRHHPKRDFGGRRSRAGDECLLLLGRHSALFGHLARLSRSPARRKARRVCARCLTVPLPLLDRADELIE